MVIASIVNRASLPPYANLLPEAKVTQKGGKIPSEIDDKGAWGDIPSVKEMKAPSR